MTMLDMAILKKLHLTLPHIYILSPYIERVTDARICYPHTSFAVYRCSRELQGFGVRDDLVAHLQGKDAGYRGIDLGLGDLSISNGLMETVDHVLGIGQPTRAKEEI